MRLIVIGASGKCGKWVVNLAHDRGHEVIAVVRPETSFQPPPAVNVIKGHVTDPDFVRRILTNQSIIISCLGIRRRGISPWAKLMSPPNLLESVTRNIINSIPEDARFIWISAAGVGSSRDKTSWIVKKLLQLGNIKIAYADLENAEKILDDSTLNYLTVRPVTLINGVPSGNTGQVAKYGLFSRVRRADVAQWILDAAEDGLFHSEKTVLLGSLPLD